MLCVCVCVCVCVAARRVVSTEKLVDPDCCRRGYKGELWGPKVIGIYLRYILT
jgi:hypothetical protein